ncbi:MAG: carbon-nitrogen hydrolase family protein, partial [Campylobacterales bacterium]|nr:carbon-nitrogen hydrolase family protein [Campylobacterales bacterium]
GVRVVLLGEYVLNRFFKELINIPKDMIIEQSNFHINTLKKLSKSYNITIIAPIILYHDKNFYKTIAKISPNSINYYYQQFFINYDHWNEEKFFAKKVHEVKSPLIFNIDNVKFALMFGFELHFDLMWRDVLTKKVDCVLLPTVTSFDSLPRWREIIKTRAFLNSCYILRANRIGEFQDSENSWKFYGDSLFCSPNGEIINNLTDKEEILLEEIDLEYIKECRKSWGFYNQVKKATNHE